VKLISDITLTLTLTRKKLVINLFTNLLKFLGRKFTAFAVKGLKFLLIFVKYRLSSQGINYYSEKKTNKSSKWSRFWKKFIYFHQSPIVRMSYHFISYIWFLLVFSYMMLYHFDLPSQVTRVHWTEIYVIITISTMLIEEFRRVTTRFVFVIFENKDGFSLI